MLHLNDSQNLDKKDQARVTAGFYLKAGGFEDTRKLHIRE